MSRYLRYTEDGCEQLVAWHCISHARLTEADELELTVGAPFDRSRKIQLTGEEAEQAMETLRKLATFDWKEALALAAESLPASRKST